MGQAARDKMTEHLIMVIAKNIENHLDIVIDVGLVMSITWHTQ